MDQKFYYDTVSTMEREQVARDYILGWIGGYMGNPKLEEQRLTPAYEAGFEHGQAGETGSYSAWTTPG